MSISYEFSNIRAYHKNLSFYFYVPKSLIQNPIGFNDGAKNCDLKISCLFKWDFLVRVWSSAGWLLFRDWRQCWCYSRRGPSIKFGHWVCEILLFFSLISSFFLCSLLFFFLLSFSFHCKFDLLTTRVRATDETNFSVRRHLKKPLWLIL